MMFDLGNAPLAASPEELIALVQEPRPYIAMEVHGASPLTQKAKEMIAANYRTDIAISDLARKLGVSHAHLSRQFKRDFGVTPIGYRHRLACERSDEPAFEGEAILDVGYEVGFNDTTRFYNDFRKVTGTSPENAGDSAVYVTVRGILGLNWTISDWTNPAFQIRNPKFQTD
jgi:AraC-like DNA-binding protein